MHVGLLASCHTSKFALLVSLGCFMNFSFSIDFLHFGEMFGFLCLCVSFCSTQFCYYIKLVHYGVCVISWVSCYQKTDISVVSSSVQKPCFSSTTLSFKSSFICFWFVANKNFFSQISFYKVGCSHCILIAQDLTRSSTFCVSNESPYFFLFFIIIILKFQLQIHSTRLQTLICSTSKEGNGVSSLTYGIVG